MGRVEVGVVLSGLRFFWLVCGWGFGVCVVVMLRGEDSLGFCFLKVLVIELVFFFFRIVL